MNTNIYDKASDNLLALVQQVWASEEAMTEWCKAHVYVELDRTQRAFLLVGKVVDTALIASGINSGSILPTDRLQAVLSLVPKLKDFNILSQLLLNLKTGTPGFDEEKMAKELKTAEEKYKDTGSESPFFKKAKFRNSTATEEVDMEFNHALALARNYKILSEMQRGTNSYRITPLGKTPALADANNFSNLSPMALVTYLKGSELYWFNTETVLAHIDYTEASDGIAAKGLSFNIKSESGGDTVKKAIATRYLASEILVDSSIMNVVPRYESLLVTGTSPRLQELLDQGLLVRHDDLTKRN